MYLKRTEVIREEKAQLLISFIEPHKVVSTSTVSRWLMNVLSAAGIDTNTFTAHSTHAASSSEAKTQCVTHKEILKRGFCSNNSTLEKSITKKFCLKAINFSQVYLKVLKRSNDFRFYARHDEKPVLHQVEIL